MKRHVMVILCDQLRKDFLPIYGCQGIDTPHINALADNGVVFDHCITQSTVCAPARATMMTGRYVSDHQVWTNDVPFREGLEYIPQRMHEEGYVTGAFGKLHHTPGRDLKGFSVAKLMEENRLKDEDDYYKYLKTKYPDVRSVFHVDRDNRTFTLPEEDYYEAFIANEAMTFMKDNKHKPTFSWVSFQGPHGPYDPPEKWHGKVKRELLKKPIVRLKDDLSETSKYRSVLRNISPDMEEIMDTREAYAEMIMEIDNQIGRILTCLKQEGLYDHTTIIFSADHGNMLGDMNIGEKGPFLYEPQLGIPMIISNHPSIDKGVRSDLLVGNIDIPGTVLDIAGANASIGYSKSILKMLKGEEVRHVNYSEFCDSIRTVENEKYRYCYYPFENYAELYDREKDPDEINNLAGRNDLLDVENMFLKEIIDFMLIGKGPQIEAHDLVPSKKAGIESKYTAFLDTFKVVFPLPTKEKYRRLQEAGLDADYNAFCQECDIMASYGKYWEDNE